MESDRSAEELLLAAESGFNQADALWATPDVAGSVRDEAAATFAEGTGELVLQALLDNGMSMDEIERMAGQLASGDLQLLAPETAAALRQRIQALSALSRGALSDQVWRIDQEHGRTRND